MTTAIALQSCPRTQKIYAWGYDKKVKASDEKFYGESRTETSVSELAYLEQHGKFHSVYHLDHFFAFLADDVVAITDKETRQLISNVIEKNHTIFGNQTASTLFKDAITLAIAGINHVETQDALETNYYQEYECHAEDLDDAENEHRVRKAQNKLAAVKKIASLFQHANIMETLYNCPKLMEHLDTDSITSVAKYNANAARFILENKKLEQKIATSQNLVDIYTSHQNLWLAHRIFASNKYQSMHAELDTLLNEKAQKTISEEAEKRTAIKDLESRIKTEKSLEARLQQSKTEVTTKKQVTELESQAKGLELDLIQIIHRKKLLLAPPHFRKNASTTHEEKKEQLAEFFPPAETALNKARYNVNIILHSISNDYTALVDESLMLSMFASVDKNQSAFLSVFNYLISNKRQTLIDSAILKAASDNAFLDAEKIKDSTYLSAISNIRYHIYNQRTLVEQSLDPYEQTALLATDTQVTEQLYAPNPSEFFKAIRDFTERFKLFDVAPIRKLLSAQQKWLSCQIVRQPKSAETVEQALFGLETSLEGSSAIHQTPEQYLSQINQSLKITTTALNALEILPIAQDTFKGMDDYRRPKKAKKMLRKYLKAKKSRHLNLIKDAFDQLIDVSGQTFPNTIDGLNKLLYSEINASSNQGGAKLQADILSTLSTMRELHSRVQETIFDTLADNQLRGLLNIQQSQVLSLLRKTRYNASFCSLIAANDAHLSHYVIEDLESKALTNPFFKARQVLETAIDAQKGLFKTHNVCVKQAIHKLLRENNNANEIDPFLAHIICENPRYWQHALQFKAKKRYKHSASTLAEKSFIFQAKLKNQPLWCILAKQYTDQHDQDSVIRFLSHDPMIRPCFVQPSAITLEDRCMLYATIQHDELRNETCTLLENDFMCQPIDQLLKFSDSFPCLHDLIFSIVQNKYNNEDEELSLQQALNIFSYYQRLSLNEKLLDPSKQNQYRSFARSVATDLASYKGAFDEQLSNPACPLTFLLYTGEVFTDEEFRLKLIGHQTLQAYLKDSSTYELYHLTIDYPWLKQTVINKLTSKYTKTKTNPNPIFLYTTLVEDADNAHEKDFFVLLLRNVTHRYYKDFDIKVYLKLIELNVFDKTKKHVNGLPAHLFEQLEHASVSELLFIASRLEWARDTVQGILERNLSTYNANDLLTISLLQNSYSEELKKPAADELLAACTKEPDQLAQFIMFLDNHRQSSKILIHAAAIRMFIRNNIDDLIHPILQLDTETLSAGSKATMILLDELLEEKASQEQLTAQEWLTLYQSTSSFQIINQMPSDKLEEMIHLEKCNHETLLNLFDTYGHYLINLERLQVSIVIETLANKLQAKKDIPDSVCTKLLAIDRVNDSEIFSHLIAPQVVEQEHESKKARILRTIKHYIPETVLDSVSRPQPAPAPIAVQ